MCSCYISEADGHNKYFKKTLFCIKAGFEIYMPGNLNQNYACLREYSPRNVQASLFWFLVSLRDKNVD